MARDYWVEPGGNTGYRFVKTPHLRRSHTHDGSQSSRGRRVDFLDVTREEYNSVLTRERTLREANEVLTRENHALKANWRTCDDELRRVQSAVPILETTVRDLELENAQLREQYGGHGHHRHHRHHDHQDHHEGRAREDEMRKLRHRNTRLRNENDSLQARVDRLERDLRNGVGDRTRKLIEEVSAWKKRCGKMEDEAERIYHKLDAVTRRNERLAAMNESLARQDRNLKRDVEYYQAILRRHGISTR